MSSDQQIVSIISLYKKHGWKLSRVLISQALSERLSGSDVFGSVEIRESDIDAAWFTRSSSPGQETWELRNLTGTPFALLQVFDAQADEGEREPLLTETEGRMRESQNRLAKG